MGGASSSLPCSSNWSMGVSNAVAADRSVKRFGPAYSQFCQAQDQMIFEVICMFIAIPFAVV